MGALARQAKPAFAQPSDAAPAGEHAERTAEGVPPRPAAPLAACPQELVSTPLEVAAFVDAYVAWQTSGSGTLATLSEHRAFSGQGANLRAENGFSLAFLGFDAKYDTGRFGAVANVRFGPGAAIYHSGELGTAASFAVEYLTQAYLLWRPTEPLELDLGMFTSPFGAEALESWKNPNYTISALYVYGQPSWHTGLKAIWQASDTVTLMALVTNGTNNISEAQQNSGLHQSATVGGSVRYAPVEPLSFGLGGLAVLNSAQNDDHGFDAFLDFVTALKLDALTATFNADFVFTRKGAPSGADRQFWGASLTASYRLSEAIGIALRGEYLRDDANYGDSDVWKLTTETLTLDLKPIPRSPNLIVRWDNRWEQSNQRIFGQDSRGTADPADDTYGRRWFESVLGVVVTTAP
jgi:hypothetical protein